MKTSRGTAPALWTCNGAANQAWTETAASQLTVFGGKCLDINGNGTANGAIVHLWDCHRGPNQVWSAR
jgi:hypothetical protein